MRETLVSYDLLESESAMNVLIGMTEQILDHLDGRRTGGSKSRFVDEILEVLQWWNSPQVVMKPIQ